MRVYFVKFIVHYNALICRPDVPQRKCCIEESFDSHAGLTRTKKTDGV